MLRFPDKPVSSAPGIFAHIRDGDWLCDFKYDGWRALVGWDGTTPRITSRFFKPLHISCELTAVLVKALTPIGPCLLDGEWMGRRDEQPESMVLFDVLELAGKSWWVKPAIERRQKLLQLVKPLPPLLRLVDYTDHGYAAFFEKSKMPGCEGIVLKRKDSPLIGSVRQSVDNPHWMKVKWREGMDGQTRVA